VEYEAPRTEAERMMAEVWGEVLRVERVGIHDNFFELGGHSLLATQIISRVRNTFRVELPLRSIFELSTLAEFAHSIDLVRQKGTTPASPAIASFSDFERGSL
jgi:acyl carrier protein